MRLSTVVWVIVIVAIFGGVLWWFMQPPVASPSPSSAAGINGSPNQGNLGQPANGTPQQPQGDGTDISQNITLGTNGSARLGTYLIGWTGMTVYTYAKDSVGTTTCYGQCAQNWPPYTVPAGMKLNIKYGVNSASAGTIVRADGTTQVTYRGLPLYFYSGDRSGSDATGQGLGGVWFVVKP
jgi:predicted lipoprotein with Yx(FWY)xxD motif